MFDVSRCQTKSGSLVDLMLGAKLRQSPAMERGIRLEQQVLAKVEALKQTKFQRCGLLLSPDFPFFGASPDGINEDCVVEIK